MRRSFLRIVILMLAVFLLSPSSAPGHAAPPGLSAEQRARVDRGDVVVLEVLPADGAGGGQGGTAVAFIPAPAEAVWRLLVDYPGHAGLYPNVVATEVLEADAHHVLVRYVVAVGPFSFRFHINTYPDAAHRRLSWYLARSRPNSLFRENWGYWHLEPEGHGVLVTYAIASRTVLPAFLTRGAERNALVKTVKAVRQRATGTS